MDTGNTRLAQLLYEHRPSFHPVISEDFLSGKALRMDLGYRNGKSPVENIEVIEAMQAYISGVIGRSGCSFAAGGYLERRQLYSASEHFGRGDDARTIHLGLDLWLPAGTPIMAPLEGRVHSFRINRAYRDYGPTIILEHHLGDERFYTLYGHLAESSLHSLEEGKKINAGEIFASVGATHENGSWPPHLHLQVIHNIGDYSGDYPGVASNRELAFYSANCPDPDILLNISYID